MTGFTKVIQGQQALGGFNGFGPLASGLKSAAEGQPAILVEPVKLIASSA